MLRSFAQGAAVGYLFPGIGRAIFIVIPWLMILVVSAVKSPVIPAILRLEWHPVILIVALLAGCWLTMELIGILVRKARPLFRLLMVGLYAFFYGAFAYEVSGADILWGLLFAMLAGWWMKNITRPAPVEED